MSTFALIQFTLIQQKHQIKLKVHLFKIMEIRSFFTFKYSFLSAIFPSWTICRKYLSFKNQRAKTWNICWHFSKEDSSVVRIFLTSKEVFTFSTLYLAHFLASGTSTPFPWQISSTFCWYLCPIISSSTFFIMQLWIFFMYFQFFLIFLVLHSFFSASFF